MATTHYYWYQQISHMLIFHNFIPLLSISLVSFYVLGAGVTTHLTYLARCVSSEIRSDYAPWLKSGSFFPDSLYSCNPNNNDWKEFAETTHWPQFLVDAIEFWYFKYGNYDNKRDSRESIALKAFLKGIFSHQVVDASWHSLVPTYESHGLLKVLAETEFNGNINEAHNFIDVMGEFIYLNDVIRIVEDNNLSFYTDKNWLLPREEDMMGLINATSSGNIDISYAQLDLCVKRGLTASLSEVSAFLSNRNKFQTIAYGVSPRARDLMQEHWIGGEFNLVSILKKCLPIFEALFNKNEMESKADVLKQIMLCGNLPPADTNEISFTIAGFERKFNDVYISPRTGPANFGSSLALGRFKNDGNMYLAVGSPLDYGLGSTQLISWESISTSKNNLYSLTLQPITNMFGSKVHCLNIIGKDYLVISEPGSNSIYFYRGEELILKVRDTSSPDAHQLQVSSVRDISGDGIPDLLLSGMNYGATETGSVLIVHGSSLIPYLVENMQTQFIEISELDIIRLDAAEYISPFQHFGAAVAASYTPNKKGFLYITCQSYGSVFVYDTKRLNHKSVPKYYIMEQNIQLLSDAKYPDMNLVPSKVHGMFGKVLLSWAYNHNNYIAISQHLFNKVFIYRENDGELKFYVKLELISSSAPISNIIGFGTAIEYSSDQDVLFISSPGSYREIGAIWKITMIEICDIVEYWNLDTLEVNSLKHLLLFNPQTNETGVPNFGKSLLAGPNDELVIGTPHHGYGVFDSKQLTGQVVIIDT